MKIVVDIPEIFEIDVNAHNGKESGFVEFFERVLVDISNKNSTRLCGQYEKEICQMFIEQFKKLEILPKKNITEDNKFFNFDAVIEIEKRKSYNQAIDKFVGMCEENTHCVYTTEQVDMWVILEIAEQLRGERNDF